LEVKERTPAHVTQLLLLELAKSVASLFERREVIKVGFQVDGSPESPGSPVLGHSLAVVLAGHLEARATP